MDEISENIFDERNLNDYSSWKIQWTDQACLEVGIPRNAREDVSISGSVFDLQHAHRDSDELHNGSRNLAISLAILRKEGIENSGSEEPMHSILLHCISVRARRKRQVDK